MTHQMSSSVKPDSDGRLLVAPPEVQSSRGLVARRTVLGVHDGQLMAGYDPGALNALVDELEDVEVIAKARR
jgi:hypothetical protein